MALHLLSAYCKPYLIYATECLGLSVTQVGSPGNTWQCAVSHIFHVTGADVQSMCSVSDKPDTPGKPIAASQ